MLLLCRGLQKITAYQQTQVTKGKVREFVTTLCASMDRKFHRMEYNTVLSETTVLDPRFKKLAFNDNRALDEALQRVTAAAARCTPSSQPAQPPGGQEGEEGARAPEVEPQTSAVWRLFDARATEDTARRNPSADVMLEVRSYRAPYSKNCRPAELVGVQGFSLPTTSQGDGRATVHRSNISPL